MSDKGKFFSSDRNSTHFGNPQVKCWCGLSGVKGEISISPNPGKPMSFGEGRKEREAKAALRRRIRKGLRRPREGGRERANFRIN